MPHSTRLAHRCQRVISPRGAKQRKKCLKIACWNVRTMLDSDDSDRPRRRSALVARELSRLDVDIAALSEVRFAKEGSLVKHGAGYTLFWSGRGKVEHRQSGVGFMLKNAIANKLHTLPTGLTASCLFGYLFKETSSSRLSASTARRCKLTWLYVKSSTATYTASSHAPTPRLN